MRGGENGANGLPSAAWARERGSEECEGFDPHNWKSETDLSRDREDRRGAHMAGKSRSLL